MSSTIYPTVTGDELAALRRYADTREVRQGEVIFTRASHGESMYVVESGGIELLFDEERPAKRIGPGEFFGELALFSGGGRRTATARAYCDSTLRVLELEALDRFMADQPEILARLLRRTCTYLVDTERRLIQDLQRRNEELKRSLDFLRRTKEELSSTELRAQTDELTGIYNRRCLNRRVQQLLDECRRAGRPLALLLIDIDEFKPINDRYGHATGDHVLQRVAATLKRSLRTVDLPCRLGGDELGAVMVDVESAEAMRRGDELLREIGRVSVTHGDSSELVSVSIGGAAYRDGDTWESLFQRADASLYTAKRQGRGRFVWESDVVHSNPSADEARKA